MNSEATPMTVTEITQKVKKLLEGGFPSVTVQGELSNVRLHTSGHLYFTLKDESSQLAGVLWRSRVAMLRFKPEDGMNVVVSGRLTVYEVRGVYQIDASAMRPMGVGELQMAFERLKSKLAAEGLFDAAHKRQLPRFPDRIGIITSPTGAVLHDMMNVLRRRFPSVEVILAPVKVQGAGAAQEIAAAIGDLNRLGDVDVLVVARGGGSLEDLWAFNEEPVARAIYASEIPVVSAVGHEVDVTIADFVADLRAPTPSAAAELIVPDRARILENVRDSSYTLIEIMQESLRNRRETIHHLLESYAFNKPIDLLRQFSQSFDELQHSLGIAVSHRLSLTWAEYRALEGRMFSLDPRLALKRGYAIVRKEGTIVGSRKPLRPADVVNIEFHDGTVRSRIEE